MSLRLKVLSVLAKIEATYAVDPTPSGAANAVLLNGQPTLTPMEMPSVQRDVLRPFFGNSESLPGSIYGKLELNVESAGPGAAGTAPAWGVLMRACGFSETILPTALTGTAQAGGSTTQIKLAASASAVDEFYNGMPISITAGTAAGQSGFIVDYDGTSKLATVAGAAWALTDATSAYSIGACTVYRRITNNPESATLYMYIDGVLHKFNGARGNVGFELSNEKIPSLKFALQGLFQPVIDAVMPTAVFSAWKTPLPANKANTPFFMLHGFQGALDSFSFDAGNKPAFHSLMGQGATDQMLITDSNPTGSISMEATTIAQKNWWQIIQTAALGMFALQHGNQAGNRIAVTMPAAQLTQPKYGEKNGVVLLNASLIPVPVSGNDELTLTVF